MIVLQRFGQGVMKYSNGDVYEGVFEYDLCSKSGRMTYKDGSVYEGNWLNNLVRIFSHTVNKFTILDDDLVVNDPE